MVLPPSSSTPTPTPVTENGQDDAAAEWKGSLQSFVVGDPGNAFKVRALPDRPSGTTATPSSTGSR